MKRYSASLFAMFMGWLVAFIVFGLTKAYGPGYPWFDDKEVWFIWTAIFVFIGWIGFVLPALNFTRTNQLLSDPRSSWLVWTVLGLVSFTSLLLWWFPIYPMIWFPAVVGFVAGVVYPMALRFRWHPIVDFTIPVVIVIGWFYLVWPLTMQHFPKVAHPFASLGEQMKMLDAALLKIQVGMSVNDVAKVWPEKFPGHNGRRSGSSWSYHYHMQSDGKTITGFTLQRDKR